MAKLIQAAFCISLFISGAKAQRAEIDEEINSVNETTLGTSTKSPVTAINESAMAVQNVTRSTTKTSEEEAALSATTKQTTLSATSQSNVSASTTSAQATATEPAPTQSPPVLPDDQRSSSPSPLPATSWPMHAKSSYRHPNTVNSGNHNYQGKSDFNYEGFRKNVYNQLYQRLQQQQEQYLQSLLFSGLFFDI